MADQHIVADEGGDADGFFGSEVVLDGAEGFVADFVVAGQFLHVLDEGRLDAAHAVGGFAGGNGADYVLRDAGLAGEARVGGELVLLSDFAGGGADDDFALGFGNVQVEAHEGTGVGDAGGEVGAVQQHAVGAAHAAAAAGDGVEELLVFGGKLVSGNVVQAGHRVMLLAVGGI